jgi:AraC family transcriptional regulator of adaptative response/methylated-DNA-[protein]-cysteine methyltransferase
VYCRPSCAARQPRPENVAFHATRADAERAGFRPCRRCKPDQPSRGQQHAAAVAQACRTIEQAAEAPDLASLAKRAGLSPFHFHRVFKAIVGVTPKAYAQAQRAQRVRAQLGSDASVTAAIYDAGYNSNSRFYAEANRRLGMTPRAFRSGGANTAIRFAVGECSLGAILVAASERGICSIEIGDDPDALVRALQDEFPRARLIGADRDFEALVANVIGFIEAPRKRWNLPLDICGTAFQQRVWRALTEIPAGATVSYGDLAARIGAPGSARAVAQACGANRLAVAIPCHRVVRRNGDVSGYRWGVERKRTLLAREAGA